MWKLQKVDLNEEWWLLEMFGRCAEVDKGKQI
jgi:hypothetical protein